MSESLLDIDKKVNLLLYCPALVYSSWNAKSSQNSFD